jgi:hypothetical protein
MTLYSIIEQRVIVKTLLHNIAAHFEERTSAWFMAGISFGVGIVLTLNPDLLTGTINAPAYFGHMTAFAGQWAWRAAFLVIGTSSLMALTVNGTFPSFPWTPHIRFLMSSLSAVIWAELALSILAGALTIGTVVYPAIVLIEFHNVRQALKDMRGRHGRWRA